MQQAVKAGLAYFALVFGAGFLLGPVRILMLQPRFGETVATAIEMPILIVVMVFAARMSLRRFTVPARWTSWLTMGGIALALQQAGDVAVALGLRGMTLADHLAHFATPAGRVLAASLLLFVLMPGLVGWWLNRRAGRGQ